VTRKEDIVARQTWSRSERRLERRQVLLMLVLVAAVALASFALGVMVGRGGKDEQAADAATSTRQRIPVAAPADSAAEPPAEEPIEEPGVAEATQGKAPDLTFYDSLPRGEQAPLGSGINLPPEKKEPAADTTAPPKPAAEHATAKRPSPAPTAADAGNAGSVARFVVQAASFSRPDDAGVLQARLAKKGLDAYVQQADLGSKGIWYRVFVGPLPSAQAAEKVVTRLKAEENLSALVRKR
jgi:cell division septation protein DedD